MVKSSDIPSLKCSTPWITVHRCLQRSASDKMNLELGATILSPQAEQILPHYGGKNSNKSTKIADNTSIISDSWGYRTPKTCPTGNRRRTRNSVFDFIQNSVFLVLPFFLLLANISLASSYESLCPNVNWTSPMHCNCSVDSFNSSSCTNLTTNEDLLLYSCTCGSNMVCNISISNSSDAQVFGSCNVGSTDPCFNTSCPSATEPCANVTCLHNGTCVPHSTNSSYSCVCPTGFSGAHCEVNIDECNTTDLCHHNGTCVDGIGNYTCNCTEGYEGHDCTQPNCSLVNCHNGGTCEVSSNDWFCNCVSSYTGHHCETDVDECNSTICQNNATCSNFPGGYNCSCTLGFFGDNCSHHNACFINPCQNNGTCTSVNDSYQCSCAGGFMGVNCSEIDHCSSSPCIHGNCNNIKDGYSCSCHPEYIGHQCNILNHCFNNSCKNDGFCVLLPANDNSTLVNCTSPGACFVCNCNANYTGSFCETLVAGTTPSAESGPPVGLIVGLTVGLFVLLVIIVAVVLIVIILNKRKNLGTYHPSQQEMNNARLEINGGLKPPPEERLI